MELRPTQRHAAEDLYEALVEGKLAILEAPTGWGKTPVLYHVALRIAEEEGRRVAYLVNRRSQIASPAIVNLRKFHPGTRYGFLYSKPAMCPVYRNLPWSLVEKFCNPRRCGFRPRKVEFSEIEAAGLKIDSVVDSLASEGACPYYSLASWSKKADVFIGHYAYYFVPKIRERVGLDPSKTVIVVDEIHNLETVASMDAARLTLSDAEGLYRAARLLPQGVAEALKTDARRLRSLLNTAGSRRRVVGTGELELSSPGAGLAEELEKAALKGYSSLEPAFKLLAFAEVYGREDYIVVLGRDEVTGEPYVEATASDPATVLAEPINSAERIVGASATPHSENYIKVVWGVEKEVEFVRVPEPIGFMETYVVNTVTTKYEERGTQVWRRLAKTVILATKLALSMGGGGVLAVFPSYRVLTPVKHLLENYLSSTGIPIIGEPNPPSLAEIRRRVAEERVAIITAVAGGRLVEGVELLDEEGRSLIKAVVLAGAPFPEPDEALERVASNIASRSGRRVEDVKRILMVNIARMRSLQALGRAVRNPGEYAIALLADRRFLWLLGRHPVVPVL